MAQQTLEGQVHAYLQICRYQKNLDEKTVKAYRIDLEQFLSFLENENLELSRGSISAYVMDMNRRFKPRSVKRKIASLKAFLNYMEREDLIERNPFSKLRISLREPMLLPKTIPLRTIQQLLSAAYEQAAGGTTPSIRKYALRDAAIMELLFATGVRVSELCRLNVADVDLVDGSVKIYGKGNKERMVQIGIPDVLRVLAEYHERFGGQASDPFFLNHQGRRISEQSVRIMLNKYAKQIDKDLHVTPHMFRHSFATLLLEENVDIRYIQQLLGHSSITTTQIYTHVATAKQRDILTRMHPRNKMTF